MGRLTVGTLARTIHPNGSSVAFVRMRMSSLSTLGHTPLDSLDRKEPGSSMEHDQSSVSEAVNDTESSAASSSYPPKETIPLEGH